MALILALETSTKNCSVALFANEKLLAAKDEVDDKYAHAERLNLMIDTVLAEANVVPSQLDAIAVGKGPGSYTGLRIGVSSAKGLAFSLAIPLLSFASLEPLFYEAREAFPNADVYIPMIDARRIEVFTSIYSSVGSESPIEAVELDQQWFDKWKQKELVLIGDGAAKCAELVQSASIKIKSSWPSCIFVGAMLNEKYKTKQFEDVAYFEPFYLKEFIAGKPKKLSL